MTKHANAPASRNETASPVTELNETDLAVATGGSSGRGAGKVTFNPFVITRKIDQASPNLFR